MACSKVVVVFVIGLFISVQALAYVFSRNADGTARRWNRPSPTFHSRWVNASGLSYTDVFQSFTHSLQRWKYAGSSSIGFDYWQGANSATPASYGIDNVNAIFFASQSTEKLGPSIIASTYSWITSSGEAIEADIGFNDIDFVFTTNPADSSAVGTGNKVFLENVATHEIGHSFGLAHSAVLQSSMVYLESRGQAKLSCDDIQAVANLYPQSGFKTGRGNIEGRVMAGSSAVFGAHVNAISKTRGTVVASVVTERNGNYTIGFLEPGDYYLFVEPFQSSNPLASICGGGENGCFYGTVNSTKICEGGTKPFKRGFVEASPGFVKTFRVDKSSTINAGTVDVSHCQSISQKISGVEAVSSAPSILSSNATNEVSVALVGVLPTFGDQHFYKLENVRGKISAKVLSYSLYSKFDPTLLLLASDGSTAVNGTNTRANVFLNSSNYVNYDSAIDYSANQDSTYYIKVKNGGLLYLTPHLYPAGTSKDQIDPVAFYILIVTINDSTEFLPSTQSPTLANNARCEALDSFPAFADHGPPAGTNPPPPPTDPKDDGDEEKKKSFGCGSIEGTSGGNSGAGQFLFSLWGIAIMLMLSRIGFKRLSR